MSRPHFASEIRVGRTFQTALGEAFVWSRSADKVEIAFPGKMPVEMSAEEFAAQITGGRIMKEGEFVISYSVDEYVKRHPDDPLRITVVAGHTPVFYIVGATTPRLMLERHYDYHVCTCRLEDAGYEKIGRNWVLRMEELPR